MGQLIEHSDEADAEVVRVGSNDSPVSLKIYQDIYHQITGRTEQMRKRYSENVLIDFSDIEQLHFKVQQLCDVHKIIAQNETISVFHEQDRKEQFTSFERFCAYNANAASPSTSVVLKYNFSIVPADLQRPQEYIVTIKLTSRVAMLRQIESDLPSYVRRRIIGFGPSVTTEVSVDYADYIVARGFLEAFDEWMRGCRKSPDRWWVSMFQKWSHALPDTLAVIGAILIAYFALTAVHKFFTPGHSIESIGRFFIVFSSGFFVLVMLMRAAGRLIDQEIKSYFALSYLNLNKGDAQLIREHSNRQRGIMLRFIAGCVWTVILGILSSRLASMI